MDEYYYKVRMAGSTALSAPMKAKSMIDAARECLGTDNVRKMTSKDFMNKDWQCLVYKYKVGCDTPYSEGYYYISTPIRVRRRI